jgi:hypothetical protein
MFIVHNYFYQQWITKNFNWFEGAYQGIPSTDNGLKSNNKWIKESIIKKQINFYGRCAYSSYLAKLISH